VTQDQTFRRAARPDRPEYLVGWRRFEETGFEMRTQIARPRRFMRRRKPDCFV